MTIKELKSKARIQKIVIVEKEYLRKIKVIDLETNKQALNNYLDNEVFEIQPYIESRIDYDGELRAVAKIQVIIYENEVNKNE